MQGCVTNGLKHNTCCMIVTLRRPCNRMMLLINAVLSTNNGVANPLKLARNDKTVLTRGGSDLPANTAAISAALNTCLSLPGIMMLIGFLNWAGLLS